MKVGIAGVGFMGKTHLTAFAAMQGVQVAAISATDPRTLAGDLSHIGGNLDRPAAPYDLSEVQKFTDWREMIRSEKLDAVDVCLPTDLHATVTIEALNAGKHVLCEKPMALTTADCDRMLAVAANCRRVLMIGQVLRFWPEYEYLRAAIESGQHGRVISAMFIRRCGLPDWSRWLPQEERSGGAVLDLLVHDIDQILLLFGIPERISAKSMGGPDTVAATLLYPRGPEVRLQGGWFSPEVTFSMSFQVRFERAEIELSASGLTLSDESGNRHAIQLGAGDAYERELAYFVDCCRTETNPDRCAPDDSARAVKLALLIKESRTKGGEQLRCLV